VPAAAVLAVDAMLVLVFAAIGRRSHDESAALVGIFATALPFLAGMAVGWLGCLAAARRAPRTVRDGIPVWVCAVGVGMALRAVSGAGTALPFVIVATITLGVLLLGWRSVATAVRTRRG